MHEVEHSENQLVILNEVFEWIQVAVIPIKLRPRVFNVLTEESHPS